MSSALTKYCKVEHCRFPQFHTTAGHKCICNRYGHGQIECKNRYLKEQLNQHLEDKLPEYLQCKILNFSF